jgi:hypothetical protein
MINILPKNFDTLLTNEREIWKEAQVCIEKITNEFELAPTTKPPINNFYLLTSKRKPTHFTAWKVTKARETFKLCLIQYESSYTSAGPVGGYTHLDTSLYLFGQLSLKKDFGISLIRPETLQDKLSELFVPAEIDLKDYPLFSYKYYVIAAEKEKFQNLFASEFFLFMEKNPGLQIEFRNRQCLFRLPKAIDTKEGLQLCSIGLTLDKILNANKTERAYL